MTFLGLLQHDATPPYVCLSATVCVLKVDDYNTAPTLPTTQLPLLTLKKDSANIEPGVSETCLQLAAHISRSTHREQGGWRWGWSRPV